MSTCGHRHRFGPPPKQRPADRSGGNPARLPAAAAALLEGPLGPWGKWAFLVGAWGAVFSSLLGVWQAVPYLFTDLWILLRRREASGAGISGNFTSSRPYRAYLFGLFILPLPWIVTIRFT